MKIALTNLKKYNEGELVFEWVDLPCDDFEPIFDSIGHDEYFISDYECEFSHMHINEYESLSKLNGIAEKLEDLDDYKLKELQAIIESEYNDIAEALDILEEECFIFYEAFDLEELAEMFIEDEIFGNIPENIKRYIDYEKFARDLKYDGYIETSVGVIIYE